MSDNLSWTYLFWNVDEHKIVSKGWAAWLMARNVIYKLSSSPFLSVNWNPTLSVIGWKSVYTENIQSDIYLANLLWQKVAHFILLSKGLCKIIQLRGCINFLYPLLWFELCSYFKEEMLLSVKWKFCLTLENYMQATKIGIVYMILCKQWI